MTYHFRFCLDSGARVVQGPLLDYAIEERDKIRRPNIDEDAEILEIERELAEGEDEAWAAQCEQEKARLVEQSNTSLVHAANTEVW